MIKRKHNKVTTGCLTCRKRRVKCDEAKPTCLNCAKIGRECAGYSDRKAWIFYSHPNRNHGSEIRTPVDCVPMILKTKEDKMTHQYFCEITAPQVAAFSQCAKTFWTHHVLQLIHSDPAVCHLAIATAARQQAVGSIATDAFDFATAHCTKALQLLTKPEARQNLEVMLVCCSLLGLYENFNPNLPTAEAMTHIIAALRILNDPTLRKDGILVTAIAPMFVQLELILSMFNSPSLGNGGLICPFEERRPHMPARFLDLPTARFAFFSICRWRYKYEARTSEWNGECPGFHDVQNLMLQWHKGILKYIVNLPDQDSLEAQQAKQMIVQFRLMYLGLYFSTQTELPEQQRSRPTFVDLSHPDRISLVFTLRTGQSASEEEWKYVDTTDPELQQFKLWPDVEVVKVPGQPGYIRCYHYAFGRRPSRDLPSR